MRVASAERKHVSGFTLVEMAIVLVIIGIILAGVMKGRDIVRGSQVKQFSQMFAQKWGTICQTYYDKTGQQLNDGSNNAGLAGSPDGRMDGNAIDRVATATTGLVDTLNSVGISVCTIVKSKLLITGGDSVVGGSTAHCGSKVNVMQTLVEGEYAGSQVVTVDLDNSDLTIGGKTYSRNLVVLYNVPCDVARGLDTAIDGKEDGESGNCIGVGAAGTAAVGYGPELGAAQTAVAWGTANSGNSQAVGIILDY